MSSPALQRTSCDGLLIQPHVVDERHTGLRPCDLARDCERAVERYHSRDTALVAGLARHTRYAGPREAVLAALCLVNFGCSHFLLNGGFGAGEDPDGREEARRLFERLPELGITVVEGEPLVTAG